MHTFYAGHRKGCPTVSHHLSEVLAHLDSARALRLMNELLLYAEYEAGHPVFRLMRDMQREANALEGKMQALQVLIEVSFP